MSAKNDQANMSLVGHLREIRNRIALSVTALVVAFIACFAIIKPLANAMLQMGLDAGFQYVYLSPSELLTSYFKLALVLAIVVVSPLLIFQIWGFVAPALTKKEKRAIRPALLGGFFFFCLGFFGGHITADHFGRVVECFVKRIHANLRNHSGNRFENAAVQKL